MKIIKTRSYSELKDLKTFEDRFNYLKLDGIVGEETFGYDRILNQVLYKSKKWRRVRDEVIIRDNGCDLGIDGRDIYSRITVHHMNPISVDDVLKEKDHVFNPEYLISVSDLTHKAIHYSNDDILPKDPIERKPNDTCLWRK